MRHSPAHGHLQLPSPQICPAKHDRDHGFGQCASAAQCSLQTMQDRRSYHEDQGIPCLEGKMYGCLITLQRQLIAVKPLQSSRAILTAKKFPMDWCYRQRFDSRRKHSRRGHCPPFGVLRLDWRTMASHHAKRTISTNRLKIYGGCRFGDSQVNFLCAVLIWQMCTTNLLSCYLILQGFVCSVHQTKLNH